VEEPGAVFVHDLRGRATGRPLAPWLLLAAALLWPVDIAWRRLRPSRADLDRLGRSVRATMQALRPARKPPSAKGPPTLAARLRQRHAPRSTPAEPPPEAPTEPDVPAEATAPPSPERRGEPRGGTESESLAARLKRHLDEES
jgi:hypothetical protein